MLLGGGVTDTADTRVGEGVETGFGATLVDAAAAKSISADLYPGCRDSKKTAPARTAKTTTIGRIRFIIISNGKRHRSEPSLVDKTIPIVLEIGITLKRLV